jgi:hypothetical protein
MKHERKREKKSGLLQFVFDAVFHFFTFSSSFQLPTSCTYVDDDKKMIKNEKKNGRFLKAKSCMDKNDKW